MFLAGIRNINTAGACQSVKGGFIFWGQWDICGYKDTSGRRALSLTPGIGLELGANAEVGWSYVISTGTNVNQQYGWFDTWGGDIGLVGTVSVAFATGNAGGQEIRNVQVAFSGGAALALRTGKSFTFLWDKQSDMDAIEALFGVNPWVLSDWAFSARRWLLEEAKDAI